MLSLELVVSAMLWLSAVYMLTSLTWHAAIFALTTDLAFAQSNSSAVMGGWADGVAASSTLKLVEAALGPACASPGGGLACLSLPFSVLGAGSSFLGGNLARALR